MSTIHRSPRQLCHGQRFHQPCCKKPKCTLTAPTGSFTAVSPNPLLPTPLPQQQREYWVYLPPLPPPSPPQRGHSLPCLPTLYSQHHYLNNSVSIGSISPPSPPPSPPQRGHSLPCLPNLYSQHHYLNNNVSIGSISPPPLTAPTGSFTAVSPNPLLPTPLPQQQREYWIYLPSPTPPQPLTAPTGSFTAVSPKPLLPTPLPQQQREYWIYNSPHPTSLQPHLSGSINTDYFFKFLNSSQKEALLNHYWISIVESPILNL